MVNFDPKIPIADNWDAGAHLDDAWFLFASEKDRRAYRESDPDSDIRAEARMVMEMRVQLRLGLGELTALALQSKPLSNGEPAVIPASYFKSPGIEIDWDRSTIRWNELHFADATIVAGCIPSDYTVVQKRRRPGRPSFREAIDQTIAALEEDRVNLAPPWKPVISLVRDKATQLGVGFTDKKPGSETIRRRLDKWRTSKLKSN